MAKIGEIEYGIKLIKCSECNRTDVIRCKDCRFWSCKDDGLNGERECFHFSDHGLFVNYTTPDFYCAAGERENNDRY